MAEDDKPRDDAPDWGNLSLPIFGGDSGWPDNDEPYDQGYPPIHLKLNWLEALSRLFTRDEETEEEEGHVLQRIVPLGFVILAIAAVIAIFFGAYYLLRLLFDLVLRVDWTAIKQFLYQSEGQLTLAAIVLAGGFAMFRVKRHFRRVYGLIEIGAATLGGWLAWARFSSEPVAACAATLTAVYVVVRGLENLMEGWKVIGQQESSGGNSTNSAAQKKT